MLIWILAILLFAVVGALGWFQGAVRLAVSLVGLFLGAALAIPLAPTVKPLIQMIGVTHPVWVWVWAGVAVFLLTMIIFGALAYFVHHKVEMYYKYRSDDVSLIGWERLNKAVGAFLGVVMGLVWLIVIGLFIHVVGYLTVQVSSEDTGSTLIRTVSQARKDMKETGLDKVVAPFDPASPKYYRIADIIGLIYHNPVLLSRLANYPPFLGYGENAEFQQIVTDAEYNNLLMSKGEFSEILKHPQTQAVLNNSGVVQDVLNQDLNDLYKYLETGKSAKFSEETILGKWELDLHSTMAQQRRKNPDMPASQMALVRKLMKQLASAVTLVATVDQKAILKANTGQPAPAEADPNAAPAEPDPAQTMADRYGRRPSAPAQPQQRPTAAPAAAPVPQPAIQAGAQGSWQRNGDKYEIKFQNPNGGEQAVEATADEDKLYLQVKPYTLVFTKAE